MKKKTHTNKKKWIKKYEERRENQMESTTSSISLHDALQWMPTTTTSTNNIKLSTMTHLSFAKSKQIKVNARKKKL